MATYYVRTDGSDSNAGTGSATNQAWQTITKAIGATGIGPGDTLYIAPGIYRGSFTAGFTNPANESQRIIINGDPTASQFSGVNVGPIILTNYATTTSSLATVTLSVVKPFITINNIHVTGYVAGGAPNYGQFANLGANAIILSKCAFYASTQSTDTTNGVTINFQQNSIDAVIEKCIFNAPVIFGATGTTTSAWNSNTIIRDCIFQNTSSTVQSGSVTLYAGNGAHLGGIKFYNCSFFGLTGIAGLTVSNLSTAFPSSAQNCYFESRIGIQMNTNNGQFTESYNVFQCATPRNNVASGTGSVTNAFVSLDVSMSRITGWGNYPHYAHHLGTYPINSGLSTGAPAADIYNVTWLAPSTPTIGAIEYLSNQATGAYLPTERNASTLVIAPGATSQTVELYLGATGLTSSTTGLSARYSRNRTASVNIPLVARTVAQAYTAGGFAEVDATNMPGVYRLDLPDAAVAAGADDVTVVVRGASGTNGAVLTIRLATSGLTSAQTASAVWDEAYTAHTTANSFGARVLKTTVDNRTADVGTSNHIQANIHAIVDNTSAADELKGALLHNGSDYISADLLTPVSAATSVHMGPYMLLADGLGASDPLDVNVGTATDIDVQVVDANGTGIDITGATVSAKVYNSGGTLVATYAGTATYADNGRLSFGLTTAVTATSGTYTVTVTRTTGASDIQVFGPLRLYVRPV